MGQLETLQKQNELMEKQSAILERLLSVLIRVERALYFSVPPATRIEIKRVKINSNGEEIQGEDMNLLLGQNARIAVTGIKDAAGNDARVEGDALSWTVSGQQGLGELQVADDGRSATFVRNGAVGTCQVEVSGDADLTEGVRTIVGVEELVCLGGEAVVIELSSEVAPA